MFLNTSVTSKSSFGDKLHASLEHFTQKHIVSIFPESNKYSIKFFDDSFATIDTAFADNFTNECF